MSDINLPTSVVNVHWQEEKPGQEGEQKHHEPPADKVAETYEEGHRTVTDKITILGIPIDLMTTKVQATIAGLVSEVDHLKVRLRRYERSKGQADADGSAEVLHGDAFVHALEKALNVPPPAGHTRELSLIVVNTFEDIRTSSGLLSANGTLSDVASRIGESDLGASIIGLVGGPVVGVLLTSAIHQPVADSTNAEPILSTADRVREVLESSAYTVAGLDMSLRFTVVAMPVETGQSAVHAIGQSDHVLRS